MKSTVLTLSFLYSFAANAQLSTPLPSPDFEFKTFLGFTTVTVKCSRPLTRGREIFGKLVPFYEIWRTGASDCTQLKFDDELEIGGTKIKAGNYSLFTIPTPDEWTVILNTDTTLHGTTGYEKAKDVVRFKVKAEKITRFYEMFTIELQDEANYAANLTISWENTVLKIPIKSNADAKIKAEIEDKINKKGLKDPQLYYNAANYYHTNKYELQTALAWSQKAEAMDKESFYYVNLSTKILGDLQRYPEAIESAKRAVEVGTKKKMTQAIENWQKKIEEWGKLVKK